MYAGDPDPCHEFKDQMNLPCSCHGKSCKLYDNVQAHDSVHSYELPYFKVRSILSKHCDDVHE